MKRTLMMLALPAALAFGACGGSSTSDGGTDGSTGGGSDLTMTGGSADLTMTGGNADLTMTATVDMAGPPAAPQLGAQIDRMGRPAINTAVPDPFNLDNMIDQTKDAYNADSDETKWVADWKAKFAANLAIYDGADTVCGNQALACGAVTGCTSAMAPAAGRYDTLATVLADDRLYLDTRNTTCGLYLGVELNAVGVANTDCGGRTLTEDVIDETYTAVTVGAAGFPGGGSTAFAVTDGVAMDADHQPATTFPFMAAPN